MRRAATVVLVLVLAPAAAAGERRSVTIRDNEFHRGHARPVLRIAVGDVVTWRWRSRQSHNVTVRSGPVRFASPTKSAGTFSRRFRRAGTYRLACTVHAPGMRMTVVVRR